MVGENLKQLSDSDYLFSNSNKLHTFNINSKITKSRNVHKNLSAGPQAAKMFAFVCKRPLK